ncbi:MAG TPA: OsmC family protein [Caulobacteraceae bacterium]|jgi:putative redox protein
MSDQAGARGAVAVVRDNGRDRLDVAISVGGQSFTGDEPVAAGGTGLGPAPHDLLSAALAECTALTLRLYADRKAWPLERIEVSVSHEVQPEATPRDVFRRVLRLTGPLDEAQRQRLTEIAERCPVHRTLTAGSRIETLAD